jgi:signal transduction histidine kinase
MTEEEMKHIFDRFYRSDKSRKKYKGGHGLGLSIAKIIILSHRGKIKVRSKPTEGTIVQVILPIE